MGGIAARDDQGTGVQRLKVHLHLAPKPHDSVLIKVQMPCKSSERNTVGKLHVPAFYAPQIIKAFASEFDVTTTGGI